MSRLIATVVLPLAVVVAAANSRLAPAVEPAQKQNVDFARHVYPILRRACFECHGANKQEVDLRHELRDDALESGAIEPGEPGDSELLQRMLLPRGHDDVMPAIGDPLPKRQVAIIRRWIQQGAKWPENFELKRHWAYVVPRQADPPTATDPAWSKSPIDRFAYQR
ncbi:MAG: hypothetical protein N2C14_10455, partial [Planctomycetales bacterium]